MVQSNKRPTGTTCWGCKHLEVDTTPRPNRDRTKSWWKRVFGDFRNLDRFPCIRYFCWAKEGRGIFGGSLGRPQLMLMLWSTENDTGILDCPRRCDIWAKEVED